MTGTTDFLPDDTYSFLGRTIAVRSNSPEVLDYIKSVYGRLLAEEGAGGSRDSSEKWGEQVALEVVDLVDVTQELKIRDGLGSFSLRCKDHSTLDSDGFQGEFSHPLSYVEHSFLRSMALLANGYDFIHAAAVSWDGRAVLFPGFSAHGKTTTSLKLLSRGFRHLSDDVTCLHHQDGIVVPFPRAARLDEQSLRLLGIPKSRGLETSSLEEGTKEWLVDVGSVFPDSYGVPAALRFVIFLQGFAEKTRLDRVPQARALFDLFKLGLRRPDNVSARLFGFAPFLEDVHSYDLVIGDLEEATALIVDLVSGSSHVAGGAGQ